MRDTPHNPLYFSMLLDSNYTLSARIRLFAHQTWVSDRQSLFAARTVRLGRRTSASAPGLPPSGSWNRLVICSVVSGQTKVRQGRITLGRQPSHNRGYQGYSALLGSQAENCKSVTRGGLGGLKKQLPPNTSPPGDFKHQPPSSPAHFYLFIFS